MSGTPPLSTRGVPHSPSPVGRNNCGLKTLDSSPRRCPWAVAALPSLSATLPRRRLPALGDPPRRPSCRRTSLGGTPSLPPNPPRRTRPALCGLNPWLPTPRRPTPQLPHSRAATPTPRRPLPPSPPFPIQNRTELNERTENSENPTSTFKKHKWDTSGSGSIF